MQNLVAWIEAYAVARSTSNQLVQTLVVGAMNQFLSTITVSQNLPDEQPGPEEALPSGEFREPAPEMETGQEPNEEKGPRPDPIMDAKEPIRPEE